MKLMSFLPLVFLVFSSCVVINVDDAYVHSRKHRQNVKGNGDVKTKSFDLKGFSKIQATGSFNIDIDYNEKFSVEATMDSNLLDELEFEVNGDKLYIGLKKGVLGYKQNKIKITMPKIEAIDIIGSSSIDAQGFLDTDGLALEISGSGDIKTKLNNRKKLAIDISGSGSVTLIGSADKLNYSCSGSGDLNALDCIIKYASIECSGSGNASVNVTKSLDIDISGISEVRYKGNPDDINTDISGFGEIVHLK